MSLASLLSRYTLFAVIATLANLMLQRLVMGMLPHSVGYVLGLLVGTSVGLAVKFVLDKCCIFGDRTSGLGMIGRSFLKYAVMGIATTAIFWIVETAFWLCWRTDAMREVGAVLGLTIGYIAKYQLDRQFVFSAIANTVTKP